jgi:hypothetical protein
MPVTKEFTVQMEDRPGTLAAFCRALADRNINIIGFQSFRSAGKSEVHCVVDDPASAKAVMDDQRVDYKQRDVAQTRLQNRPGELARAASLLGEADININYAFAGIDSGTNAPLLFVSVADAERAAKVLDEGAPAKAA